MKESKTVLNLGSGQSEKQGVINVDLRTAGPLDLIADLSSEFPFASNSIDEITAKYILEHLDEPYQFLAECHRVLKKKGLLKIKVPHRNSPVYKEHPDHRTGFTYKSLDYLLGSKNQTQQYVRYNFKLLNLKFFYMRSTFRPLTAVIFKLFNFFPETIKYFSHWFPLDIRMFIVLEKR